MGASDKIFDVSGSVAAISGGRRNIGLAIAEAFVIRGAKVVITGRSASRLEEAIAELPEQLTGVGSQVCDVTEPEDIERCFGVLHGRYERIDIVVNCAEVNIGSRHWTIHRTNTTRS